MWQKHIKWMYEIPPMYNLSMLMKILWSVLKTPCSENSILYLNPIIRQALIPQSMNSTHLVCIGDMICKQEGVGQDS
jgi:hypothetical protein